MKLHLDGMGIKSAMDLAKADPSMLRRKFSVVMEKTARELTGTPCLALDEPEPPKQEIWQPHVRQTPDRTGADLGSSGHLYDARLRETAGPAIIVQEDPGFHAHGDVQSRRGEICQWGGG